MYVYIICIYTGGGGLVTKSCLTLVTPWTVACQDPLFMGFFRQEYWSGLPFPAPGDLPDLGIEPRSPAFLIRQILDQLTYKGSPLYIYYTFINNLAKYISQSYSPNLDLLSSGLIDKLIT